MFLFVCFVCLLASRLACLFFAGVGGGGGGGEKRTSHTCSYMKSKRCSHNLQSNHRGNSQRFCKMLFFVGRRFPSQQKMELDPVETPTKTSHGKINFNESITTMLKFR